MIRDITIGQYYQTESVIHALDPRTKLIWTMFYIISIFFNRSLIGIAVSAAVFLLVAEMTRVPLHFMVRGLRAVLALLLFTLFFQIIFTSGEPLFSVGLFTVTKEGIRSAFFIGVRLVLLVLFSSLMTLTTTPKQLTDGLELLCSPLSRFHVPVQEISMVMAVALRFMPVLLEELDKIMKAQQARGADFERGNLIHRVRAMVPLLVPLFVAAFRRADDLAVAMDARCYHGGAGRTKMKPLRMVRADFAALFLGILYLWVIFWIRKNL